MLCAWCKSPEATVTTLAEDKRICEACFKQWMVNGARADAVASCGECKGTGEVDCSECDGEGEITRDYDCDYDCEHECRECEGTGKETCKVCKGAKVMAPTSEAA